MMWARNFKPEIHHRRSIRLKNHNYSSPGYYFITLCCLNRENLFGEIVDHKMILNEYGQIVKSEWEKSAIIREEIELDEFIIMPNHFHAIVIIRENITRRDDRPVVPTGNVMPVVPTGNVMPVVPTGNGMPVVPTGNGMPVVPTGNVMPVAPASAMPKGPEPKSIGSLMAGFKSSVTKQINSIRNKPGKSVWQRNYYERIIRDTQALNQIRHYIRENPKNMKNDEFNK